MKVKDIKGTYWYVPPSGRCNKLGACKLFIIYQFKDSPSTIKYLLTYFPGTLL